jgi:hypothetical protein
MCRQAGRRAGRQAGRHAGMRTHPPTHLLIQGSQGGRNILGLLPGACPAELQAEDHWGMQQQVGHQAGAATAACRVGGDKRGLRTDIMRSHNGR